VPSPHGCVSRVQLGIGAISWYWSHLVLVRLSRVVETTRRQARRLGKARPALRSPRYLHNKVKSCWLVNFTDSRPYRFTKGEGAFWCRHLVEFCLGFGLAFEPFISTGAISWYWSHFLALGPFGTVGAVKGGRNKKAAGTPAGKGKGTPTKTKVRVYIYIYIYIYVCEHKDR